MKYEIHLCVCSVCIIDVNGVNGGDNLKKMAMNKKSVHSTNVIYFNEFWRKRSISSPKYLKTVISDCNEWFNKYRIKCLEWLICSTCYWLSPIILSDVHGFNMIMCYKKCENLEKKPKEWRYIHLKWIKWNGINSSGKKMVRKTQRENPPRQNLNFR